MAYRTCKLDLCNKSLKARGYCGGHYKRLMEGNLRPDIPLGEIDVGKNISIAKKKAKKVRLGKAISLAKTGMKYTRHVETFAKPNARGERHYNWKGGISKQRHLEMAKWKYRVWRDTIFLRDNYTCQVCDQYGGTLHVDHIKSWSKYPELRYELDNGRTLCVSCHYYITYKRKMPVGAMWCNYRQTRKRG